MTARSLTVAHQSPGECEYCDDRHARIVAAVAHELAEKIRIAAGPNRLLRGEVTLHPVVIAMHDAADLIDPEMNDDRP